MMRKHKQSHGNRLAHSARYQIKADVDDMWGDDGDDSASAYEPTDGGSTVIECVIRIDRVDDKLNGNTVVERFIHTDRAAAPLPGSLADLLASQPDVARSDSGRSDDASEWSAVTAAETTWPVDWVIIDGAEDSSDAWRSSDESTDNDALIARLLYEEQCDGWLQPARQQQQASAVVTTVGSIAPPTNSSAAGFACFSVLKGRPQTPRLGSALGITLRARLGACIVCYESLATVVMEPCGHLALCSACHTSWACSHGQHGGSCVYCRTPGNGIHLLASPAPINTLTQGATDYSADADPVSVRLTDGLVTVAPFDGQQASEPTHVSTVEFRKAKRFLRRHERSKAHPPNRAGAGGVIAKWVRMEEERDGWVEYARALLKWKAEKAELRRSRAMLKSPDLQRREEAIGQASTLPHRSFRWRVSRPSGQWKWAMSPAKGAEFLLRLDPPRPDVPVGRRGNYFINSQQTGRPIAGSKQGAMSKLVRHYRLQEADRRSKRGELAAHRKASMVEAYRARDAAVALARSSDLCLGCGDAEASMLSYPCKHIALCRPCWEAKPRHDEACAKCGGACNLALCVRRP